MTDIVARFPCLHPPMTPTPLRPCRRMVSAMLMRTGRVTRLGWVCFRQPVYRPGEVDLRAGDAVVVTTAGKYPDGREMYLSIDEVHRQYEAIADRLRIALDLEWRKPN